MKQKNNITLLVIGVLTLLAAIVGAAYAYFSSSITPGSGLNLDVEAQANTAQFTASGGQFGFTVTGAEMQQANAGSLAKEATGSINVSLTSPKIAMCTFDVAFAWNSGSSYTATSGRGSQFEFGVLYEGNPYGAINNAIKPINFDTLISGGAKVLEDAKIIISEANGTSKTTNITLNFKVQMYNLNHDQSSLAGSSSKTYSGRFYVTNVDCQENKLYLNDVILASNEIYPDNVASTYVTSATGINFGQISSDTNGKGVYYTNQNTNRDEMGNELNSYYFRGDVDNNYVQFATQKVGSCFYDGAEVYYGNYYHNAMAQNQDITWPKMLSQEICESEHICVNNNYYSIGDPYWEVDCQDFVFDYAQWTGEEEQSLLWQIVRINEDGSVKLILEDGYDYYTYYPNLSYQEYFNFDDFKYSVNFESLSDYIQPLEACLDFEKFVYEENPETLESFTIFEGYNRLVNLNQPSFRCEGGTVNTDVYLLTADEVRYAGNENSYLGLDKFFTSTPYDESNVGLSVFSNYGNNYIKLDNEQAQLKPVINLRSDIKIVSGTGTKTNPYVISLD